MEKSTGAEGVTHAKALRFEQVWLMTGTASPSVPAAERAGGSGTEVTKYTGARPDHKGTRRLLQSLC